MIGIKMKPQGKQGLGGGPVSPVHHEAPAADARRRGNRLTMRGEAADVVLPECFRLANTQTRRQIDIDEFRVAGERESSPRPDRQSS